MPVIQEWVILPPRQGTPWHSNKKTKQPPTRTVVHACPVESPHASSPLTLLSSEDKDQHLRKRLNQGPNWAVINASETLGANQWDFITALACICKWWDVVLAFCSFLLSGDTIEIDNTSLSGLTVQHQVHSANGCFLWFWRSVLEVQIVLSCERWVDCFIEFISKSKTLLDTERVQGMFGQKGWGTQYTPGTNLWASMMQEKSFVV